MSTFTSSPNAEPQPSEPWSYDRGSPARSLRGVVPDAGVAADRLYRLSVDQYNHMAEAGILTKYDRIELIEGLLVRKVDRSIRHINTTRLIVRSFGVTLPGGWHVAKADPIRTDRSEPEPDVSVLRGDIETYDRRKPGPPDVALVVEVADASYDDDRRRRMIYAEAGIPIYWIANLNAHRIEAHSDPTGPDASPEYRSRRDYATGEEIPLVIDGREVARLPVASLLAPTQPR